METALNHGEYKATTTTIHLMIATFSDSPLAPQPLGFGFSDLKAILLEPLLMVGVSVFWILALPFVAVSLMCVKIWDTVVALKSGTANPLILRRGGAPVEISDLSEPDSVRTAEI